MPPTKPEECDELFARYLNSGDIDALLQLYEPEASHVRPDGIVPHARQGIRPALEDFVAMHPTLSVDVKNVVRAGDDLAVLYDDWRLEASGPNGEPVEMNGKGVHIVHRQKDGSWAFAVTGVNNASW